MIPASKFGLFKVERICLNKFMSDIHDRTIKVNMKELSNCTILNEDSSAIPIRTLWEKQPTILVFLRHFGCDACRVHALEVWKNREAYLAKGATLHFIGNGTPHFMNQFKKEFGLQHASFFTDPTLKTFKAAGFKRGFWIDPGQMHSRTEFLRLAIAHRIQNAEQGNAWQLGGVLAICPGGKPTYQFTSQMMGDFPPVADGANHV